MALNEKGKKSLKAIGLVVALIALGILGYRFMHTSRAVGESTTVAGFQLSTAAETTTGKTTDTKEALPTSSAVGTGTQIVWQIMEWNSQFPLMYANGGVQTTKGSLFEKAGVNCTIKRQDDCFVTIAEFIKNSEQLKENPNTIPLIMSFMGDGVPGFSAMLKDLHAIGQDPIIFYFMGRSDGEDCFWGPKEWKSNPKSALGGVVAGVERDGDINIVIKWCADNNLPINANTKTYDSFAMNIMPCTDFNKDLKTKMQAGYTETRDLVKNGKTVPGVKVTVKAQAYTTWSPVDGDIVPTMEGMTRIASTKEYAAQMPNAAIINKKWAYSHINEMHGIVKALGLAGDQVRSFPEAAYFAAKVSVDVYQDPMGTKPEFFLNYARGVEVKDANGGRQMVGGSKWFNLADAANMCGLGKDGIDRYKITYETFGNILAKLYPDNMKGWIPYKEIMDKSFISAVLANNTELKNERTELDEQEDNLATGELTDETSSKTYNIQFATGSDVISEKSKADLSEIFKSKVVSGGLRIGIYGHADNTGTEAINQPLSERRAEAVAAYLRSRGIGAKYIFTKGYGSQGTVTDDHGNVIETTDPRHKCVEIRQGK